MAIRYQRDGYETSLVIYNIALYFLIAERDIQAIKLDALTHPDPWKRSLCIRTILLTIYERDIDKVAGSKLKKAFDTLQVPAELRQEATEALRAIRKVQEKAKTKLSLARNATIAHRDPDALLQYRLIRDLKVKEVFSLTAEFYEGADRFIQLVPKLMMEAGCTKALVRQVLDKGGNTRK